MSPFDALCGRPCHTPLSWYESGERVIFAPDIVTEEEEKVKQIQANILAVQSRQKSYTDKRRNHLEFEVGDHVYLRASPMKDVRRFGIKGKLAPRYIDPYPIIDRHGTTSYQVEFPTKLSRIHNVFHVSQLKRCLKPSTKVVIEDTISLEPNLTYKAYPNKTESPVIRLLGSTRSNRMSTLKMKPHGNVRTYYEPTTPTSFHRGNRPTPNCFYALLSISG
jgi:hypothetical protein